MRGGLSHPPPPCHRPLPLQSVTCRTHGGWFSEKPRDPRPLLLCTFKDVAETSLRRRTGRETRLEPKKPVPSAPSSITP